MSASSYVPVTVIGGGVAGLAAATLIVRRLGVGSVALIERTPSIGGKLVTVRREGFLVEAGPDSFLASKPGGVELVQELGLSHELIRPNAQMRGAWVRREGRLHPLPEGMTGLVPGRLAPLLRTRLLSLRGRVRAALEWFVACRAGDDDESLADFTRRRFGPEVWDWLVEPLLSGIYAGDGRHLSLRATFPQLADSERLHGGVLRAMVAAQRDAAATPGRPAGFVTLAPGMGQLVAAMGHQLDGGDMYTGVGAQAIRRDRDGYCVECTDGRTLVTGAVVAAVPACEAAGLVGNLDETLGVLLREIPFVNVATVSVAFRSGDVGRPLRGTGWISPRAEGGPVVACTWVSNKFTGRAPAGHILLRFFIGRAGADQIVMADDVDLQSLVRETLARVHDIHAEPVLWHVHRWPKGMPQYTMGHGARLAAIGRRLDALPGLCLAGSSYHGVGIPDSIRSGWAAAERALASLTVNA